VRSLQSRLLLTYLMVAGLVLALLGASLLVFLAASPLAVRQTYTRMQLAGAALAEREPRTLRGQGVGRLQQMLARLDLSEARMLIVGPSGEVISDSQPDRPGVPLDLAGLAALTASTRGEFRDGAQAYLYNATPLDGGGGVILILPRPGVRLGSLLGEDFIRPFLQAGVVALAVSMVLAWLVSRWVAAPMERLATAARRVADGDYRAPTDLSGPAEVQGLAGAFAEMVERVRAGQQSQRDFVANVSHELRTPLTSIQGFAQAIRDGAARDPAEVRRAGEVIFEESERLKHLVEDLLDLARLDAGQAALQRAPVDLGAVIGGVIERLSLPADERQVRLSPDLTGLPTIVGDGDRLAQVFTNLIDNALRHSPAGGEVVVRGHPRGSWLTVTVEDQGPGIPPGELSRIFERFYQVDKARSGGPGRGTGLGLAISKEIVEAHGGRLLAESATGVGSRFSVQLPTALPDDATPIRRRPRL
jgi:signal transduction histidine kinase